MATPKAIAWLDLATNRLWVTLVFLDKGKGITARHVVASFVEMVSAWGVPRHLYLDNGSEYGWTEFVTDALSLVGKMNDRLSEVAPWQARRSAIVNALPYNAPAKPIEGIFGLLERLYLRNIPGWIGGDRLRKKTANHGREPDPFPGSMDELRAAIGAAVGMYHVSPQLRGSALKGMSPFGALQAALGAGWQGAIFADPDTLRMAFAADRTVTVSQGAVSFKGQRYTCRELQAYQGDRVSLRIPKYEDWSRLPVIDEGGRLLGFAEPDRAFGILDPAGAVESHARGKAHRAGLRELQRQAPTVDVPKLVAETWKQLTPEPKTPVAGHLSPSADAREIMDALAAPPAATAAERAASTNRLLSKLAQRFLIPRPERSSHG